MHKTCCIEQIEGVFFLDDVKMIILPYIDKRTHSAMRPFCSGMVISC